MQLVCSWRDVFEACRGNFVEGELISVCEMYLVCSWRDAFEARRNICVKRDFVPREKELVYIL